MRCTKKLCTQLAVDGGNYCQVHLKLTGAPRPGISNSRSAGTGRYLQGGSDAQRTTLSREKAAPAKKAATNPLLLGTAKFLAQGALTTPKKASTGSDAKPAAKTVGVHPKTRGG